MAFSIDKATYDKAKAYSVSHGYSTRSSVPTSVVAHSTNNGKTTSFEHEANYLYTSPDVSAHFLIGKDGRIVQFLDPRIYQAWHAGTAQEAFTNPRSIGIELHKSIPDLFYPQVQLDAFGWLLKQLAAQFQIAPSMIDTHGQIAIAGPYIRKTDPDKWPHADFIAWRNALFVTDPLKARTIPGLDRLYYCGVGFYDFYTQHGGFSLFGYPLADENHSTGMDGRACTYMPFERVVLKYVEGVGVHLALLDEALARGWIV